MYWVKYKGTSISFKALCLCFLYLDLVKFYVKAAGWAFTIFFEKSLCFVLITKPHFLKCTKSCRNVSWSIWRQLCLNSRLLTESQPATVHRGELKLSDSCVQVHVLVIIMHWTVMTFSCEQNVWVDWQWTLYGT